MPTTPNSFTLASHFEGKDPIVRKIYDQLFKTLRQLGPISVEPKKTSIHLMNATALAGVATRKAHLVLTIKSDHPLQSPRIHKSEKSSQNSFRIVK
jgi:hypothetical protein